VRDEFYIVNAPKCVLVLTKAKFLQALRRRGMAATAGDARAKASGVAGEMRQSEGPHMRDRDRPPDMPPELAGHLITLFEQHFRVTLRKMKDPRTGREYVDLRQVCETLGLYDFPINIVHESLPPSKRTP
jgi:hypothetical protein